MKTIFSVMICLCCLAGLNAQERKIEINAPMPAEYSGKTGSIYVNDTVEFITSKKTIFSTYGTSFLLHAAIIWQVGKKEDKVAEENVFKNDTVLLPELVMDAYKSYFSRNNIEFAASKDEAEYIMDIRIYDHGFHWATSSAAGMFVRTKIELKDLAGRVVWEQHYTMTKDEAKKTFSKGAINMNKAIDKLIDSFAEEPDLLSTSYEQIIGFLPSRLFPATR